MFAHQFRHEVVGIESKLFGYLFHKKKQIKKWDADKANRRHRLPSMSSSLIDAICHFRLVYLRKKLATVHSHGFDHVA